MHDAFAKLHPRCRLLNLRVGPTLFASIFLLSSQVLRVVVVMWIYANSLCLKAEFVPCLSPNKRMETSSTLWLLQIPLSCDILCLVLRRMRNKNIHIQWVIFVVQRIPLMILSAFVCVVAILQEPIPREYQATPPALVYLFSCV